MAAIELEGLTKRYGDVLAADGLTFEVDSGEIFGYLGPNGAGKTTTIRMLMGFISPTSGTARVLGADVRDRTAHREARRRIGYLSDQPGFDEQSTGAEVVAFHGSVKGDARSEQLLETFSPPLDRRVREYSRGNVQKLGLVTTFMHDPDLVVLDEPTTGLDPLMKQRFAEFLRAERDRGVTVLFSSHLLGEVRRLCDRVGIIRNGELVTVDPIESLLDRSGKVIRIRAAEPIPLEAIDVAGVHDLEASRGGESAGSTGHSQPGESTGTPGHSQPGESAGSTGHPQPDESPLTEGPSGVSSPRDADGTSGVGAPDRTTGAGGATESGRGDAESGATAPADADASSTFTECAFTFTGDINDLLEGIRGHRLVDLSIEEAPLEDVFMRFYGGDD